MNEEDEWPLTNCDVVNFHPIVVGEAFVDAFIQVINGQSFARDWCGDRLSRIGLRPCATRDDRQRGSSCCQTQKFTP